MEKYVFFLFACFAPETTKYIFIYPENFSQHFNYSSKSLPFCIGPV